MSYAAHCFDKCGNPSTPLPEWPPFWNGGTPVVPPDPILNIVCPVSPVSAIVTATAVTVLVSGTLFTPTTQATVNGTPQTPTNVASASQLSFQLDPSAYTAGTILQIGVTDGGVVGMTTCPFEILSALILPTITSVTPDYVGRQGPVKTLTVIGTNFVAAPDPGASQVTYNFTGVLPTTFVSPTELSAVMDPNIVMVGGHMIGVANGPLTNRSPTTVTCNCVHNPTVSMMDINTVPSGGATPTTVTVVGSYYGDTAKVLVDGVEVTTNRLSGGALEFTMPPEPAPVVRQISVRLGHDHPPPHGHDNVVVTVPPLSLPFTYT